MVMTAGMRSSVLAATAVGALAVASALITGPGGNDGLEGVRHTPYRDVAGVLTVCYGHTGRDIIPGKVHTEAECRKLLRQDLDTVARQITPYIRGPLPVATQGALYAFAYNVGAGNFIASTLLRRLSAGDRKGACDELRRWIYAGGRKWKGLVSRREIEREVCLWGQS